MGTLPTLMHLDVSNNQLTRLPKELMAVLAENNSFCVVTEGNPLNEEGIFIPLFSPMCWAHIFSFPHDRKEAACSTYILTAEPGQSGISR